ncbi:hypothetical protein [Priestia filamentosa]|nr:hypothetical protein [Priestia filamentosa]
MSKIVVEANDVMEIYKQKVAQLLHENIILQAQVQKLTKQQKEKK